jgi:hypothetical protein
VPPVSLNTVQVPAPVRSEDRNASELPMSDSVVTQPDNEGALPTPRPEVLTQPVRLDHRRRPASFLRSPRRYAMILECTGTGASPSRVVQRSNRGPPMRESSLSER